MQIHAHQNQNGRDDDSSAKTRKRPKQAREDSHAGNSAGEFELVHRGLFSRPYWCGLQMLRGAAYVLQNFASRSLPLLELPRASIWRHWCFSGSIFWYLPGGFVTRGSDVPPHIAAQSLRVVGPREPLPADQRLRWTCRGASKFPRCMQEDDSHGCEDGSSGAVFHSSETARGMVRVGSRRV